MYCGLFKHPMMLFLCGPGGTLHKAAALGRAPAGAHRTLRVKLSLQRDARHRWPQPRWAGAAGVRPAATAGDASPCIATWLCSKLPGCSLPESSRNPGLVPCITAANPARCPAAVAAAAPNVQRGHMARRELWSEGWFRRRCPARWCPQPGTFLPGTNG